VREDYGLERGAAVSVIDEWAEGEKKVLGSVVWR
jgi:hypothetical protein